MNMIAKATFIRCKLLTVLLAAILLGGCKNVNQDFVQDSPSIRWTAFSDERGFTLDLLENMETHTLYTGNPESGTYSHHSHITYFDDVLLATWDNQVKDENGSGQQGLYRKSFDRGRTWTPVEPLFPSQDRRVAISEAYIGTRHMTSNGFIVIEGTLFALTLVSEWTGPSIEEKRRKHIGHLCRALDPRGELGGLFWLSESAPLPVDGFPSYKPGDPELVKKIREHVKLPGKELQLDFSEIRPISDDEHRLSEPVPSYAIADGSWVRLFRDMGHRDARTQKEKEGSKSRRLYASISNDNGVSWSVPERTGFPDACARSNAGKLPDGQVYIINNLIPMNPGGLGGRSMLTISLSDDGLNFDRVAIIRFISPPIRHEGLEKTIGYQYPHSVVDGDDLWVLYSVNKEDVQVTRIPLETLYDI